MDWYPLKGDGHTLWGRPFFGDEALDAQLAKRSDVLWRTENGRRSLALPWESGQPFPLTELFCFARVQAIQGQQCVIYRVGADGLPLLEE